MPTLVLTEEAKVKETPKEPVEEVPQVLLAEKKSETMESESRSDLKSASDSERRRSNLVRPMSVEKSFRNSESKHVEQEEHDARMPRLEGSSSRIS
jgi:hypothetical protein